MDELLDVLDSSLALGRGNAGELRPATRIYLSLLVFGVTLLAAFAAGWLSSRWAHRRTGEATSERNERTIVRLRRSFVALVVALGAYLAVEMAPLPARLDDWISGAAFVLGASGRRAARSSASVALLLTSSVTHVGGSERARLEREYVPLAEKATSLAVSFILVIVVAKHFGKDVTSLVAALGVGSLAIGLAAQQTLGNMIAGFVLLVDRPFRPGDRVRLATAKSARCRSSACARRASGCVDGNVLIVPNAELANSRVVTYSVSTTRSRRQAHRRARQRHRARGRRSSPASPAEDAQPARQPTVRVSNVTRARDRADGRLRYVERRRGARRRRTSCGGARWCGCRRSGSRCPTTTSRRRACRAARPCKRRGRCRS